MPDEPQPISPPGRSRWLRRGALVLLGLVGLVGASLGIARFIRENGDLDRSIAQRSVQSLQTGDAEERLSAVRDIGRFGAAAPELTIPALLGALADADAEIRAAAAEGFPQVIVDPNGARVAADALIASMKDSHPSVRIASTLSIVSLASMKRSGGRPRLDPERALAVLTEGLGDRDPASRYAAIQALALVGPEVGCAPPEPLVSLLDGPSETDRAGAVVAITSFTQGIERLLPSLFRVLERAGPRTRTACADALYRLRPPTITAAVIPTLTEALRHPDRRVRCSAVVLLVSLGPEARGTIPLLIQIVRESVDSGPVVEKPGEPILDPFQRAISALGTLAPETPQADEAIAALIAAFDRGHRSRRADAAYALRAFSTGAETAIPCLIARLRESDSVDAPPVEGGAIARTLGEIAPGTSRADQAINALMSALDAQSPWTRQKAIEALGQFGPSAARALPRLRTFEADPSFAVRAAATKAVRSVQASPAPTTPAQGAGKPLQNP